MLEALLPYKDQIIKLGFKSSGGGGGGPAGRRTDARTPASLARGPSSHDCRCSCEEAIISPETDPSEPVAMETC